jgi:NitT/TauT family transport system permease protein
MKRFTTANNAQSQPKAIRLWAVAVWLAIWQLASLRIGHEILLASPVAVALRLAALVGRQPFWGSVWFSFMRIVSGFLLAMAGGILFAVLSAFVGPIRQFLAPAISIIKATPVASFIILALTWIPSRNLSVFISFLMVLPVIYTNVLDGILSVDHRLVEMADVFRVGALSRARYIYLSQVMPFFRSACSISLGLCWKSGVAAEVIGIPKGSIGEKLYNSKIFYDIPELFAWTVVIILVSLLFERLFLSGVDRLVDALERT